MSNYNTELQSNNADLQAILDTINELPDPITLETPVITVSSNGLITASANGLSATEQLATQGAQTITPTDSVQTAVSAGTYVTGDIKVGASAGSQVAMGSVTVAKNKTSITITPGFVVKTLCLATEGSVGGTYNNGTISTTEDGITSVSSTATSTVITLAESLSGVTSTKCWWMAAS